MSVSTKAFHVNQLTRLRLSKEKGRPKAYQPECQEQLRLTGFKKRQCQERYQISSQQSVYPFVQQRQVELLSKMQSLSTPRLGQSRSVPNERPLPPQQEHPLLQLNSDQLQRFQLKAVKVNTPSHTVYAQWHQQERHKLIQQNSFFSRQKALRSQKKLNNLIQVSVQKPSAFQLNSEKLLLKQQVCGFQKYQDKLGQRLVRKQQLRQNNFKLDLLDRQPLL